MKKRLEQHTGIRPGLKLEEPNVSVIPSEFDLERISKKLISRSKKLKIVYDAIEVLESNLIRAEQFLKNN